MCDHNCHVALNKPQMLTKEHYLIARMIHDNTQINKYPNLIRESGWGLPRPWDTPIVNKIKKPTLTDLT